MAELHPVHFSCTFCGHAWTEELAIPKDTWSLPWCRVCGVTDPKKGQQVRYGAWDREQHHSADKRLERGAVYTIAKILRWQHGCNIQLREAGTWNFPLLLFTPVAFTHKNQGEEQGAYA